VAATGTLIAVVTTVAALLTRGSADWRTSAFLVLGLAQLGIALALRDRGAARGNPFLNVAVALAVLLQVAAVVLAPLRRLLETAPLPPDVLAACGLLAAVPGLALWGVARWDVRLWSRRARRSLLAVDQHDGRNGSTDDAGTRDSREGSAPGAGGAPGPGDAPVGDGAAPGARRSQRDGAESGDHRRA
jgi:hypothetical protein